MKRSTSYLIVTALFVIGVFLITLYVWLFQQLFNWVVPNMGNTLFNGVPLTFWQAIGTLVLIYIFFAPIVEAVKYVKKESKQYSE